MFPGGERERGTLRLKMVAKEPNSGNEEKGIHVDTRTRMVPNIPDNTDPVHSLMPNNLLLFIYAWNEQNLDYYGRKIRGLLL
jgi:hypothetical protein